MEALNAAGELLAHHTDKMQSFYENIAVFSPSYEVDLRSLFDALDANHDGAIQFEEFQGMTVNVWAALYQVAAASLMRLGSFKEIMRNSLGSHLNLLTDEKTSMLQIFTYYFVVMLLIQVALFVGANIHDLLGRFGFVRIWKFPSKPKDLGVVPKEAALVYDTPIRKYEIIKILFMVLSGMMVIRLLCGIVSFILACCAISCSSLYQNNLWRNFFRFLTRVFVWLLHFFLGYYVMKQHGSFAPPSTVKLLAGTHVGIIEVIILFVWGNFPSFVSREENLSIPLFPGVVKAADAILVNRTDKDSKKKTVQEISKRSLDPESPQLMIFPEGTCNNQRALFKFSKGAFVTGQPVQPVLFKFPYTHFNPCYTGRPVGGNDMSDLIFRTLCQFVNRVEVKVMDVYYPSEEEKQNAELYASNVEKLMAMSLGIPRSEATFMDYNEAFDRYVEANKAFEEEQKGGWMSKMRSRRWGSRRVESSKPAKKSD